MNKNSFRINNNLKSFQLDKEFMFYLHTFKETIRANFFEFIWLWKWTLLQLSWMISQKDFNEPYELFESVLDFFATTHPTISICIYQHQPFDNSLVLYQGDHHTYPKKIFLNDLHEAEYHNERQTIIKEDILMTNIRGQGIWSKAAICIHWFILCFYMKERYFEKHIRTLNTIFTIWFADLIKAKLNVLESKYQDPRTGLHNSKYISDAGEKRPYSIIKIDINDFKMVNDTYWHTEWDIVLEQLWLILKTSLWISDKACRDWWDEFLLLIDSPEAYILEKIVARINKSLEALNEKRAFPIHVSMGYSIFDGSKSFIDRINEADDHMYKQKNENSQIYRLARKIASIKDPSIFNELLIQIVKNASSSAILQQIYDVVQLTKNK
ncbi:MAG: diguanylate cyclase and metal dependent phosphohydrolase [uncultured bacterium (gcode 4)]|uniref:Diguanylate cyclase and metal dependent phosphohydrolase n=1 Tax=uncultured bacterium (gcode 4) TaxID=1234023 RepID=K2FX06_9BACT|nr:MAG: diguanylate cyclase and metal dependent phosphohydrolase [uncultured bacterium (gcode 4)]